MTKRFDLYVEAPAKLAKQAIADRGLTAYEMFDFGGSCLILVSGDTNLVFDWYMDSLSVPSLLWYRQAEEFEYGTTVRK